MKAKRITRATALILVVMLMVCMFAGCATTTTDESGEETTSGGGYSMIIMLVILIVIFYFFLIRPENKKKKQSEEMRSNLGVGDEITTIGGLVGKIVSVQGDNIVFETGEDRVRIQVTKWAISSKGKQTEQNK